MFMSFTSSTVLYYGHRGDRPLQNPCLDQSSCHPFKVYSAQRVCQKALYDNASLSAWKAAELDIEREPINRLKRAGERLLHRRH